MPSTNLYTINTSREFQKQMLKIKNVFSKKDETLIPSIIPSHLDRVFLMINCPSRYHVLVAFLLCCMQFPVAFNEYLLSFYKITPPHRCKAKSNLTLGDYELRPIITVNGKRMMYSSCELYKDPFDHSKGVMPCDKGWEFLLMNGEKNVITEWELVCERQSMAAILPYMYTVAALVGAMITGVLADKYGRKSILLWSLLTHTVLGVMSHFLPIYSLFAAVFSFQGFSITSIQCTSYLLLIENLPTVWQWKAALAVGMFQCCGQLLLAVLAWLIRHWRYIQLVISAPGVVVIGYFWLLPKSLAWLVAENRIEAANIQLEKFCTLPGLAYTNSLRLQLLKCCRVARSTHSGFTSRHGYETIVCSARLRNLAFVQYFVWFVVSLISKCNVEEIPAVKGNPYSQMFVHAVMELGLTVLFFIVTKRVGLKMNQGMALSICGICCIFSAIVNKQVTEIKHKSVVQLGLPPALALLGQSISRALSICIWMHAIKTFPTGVRALGLGTCVFWAKIAHLFVPHIDESTRNARYAALAAGGVLSLFAALLSIWLLPDCTKRPLATIPEEIEIGRTKIVDDSDPALRDTASASYFVPNIPNIILEDSNSSLSRSSATTAETNDSSKSLLAKMSTYLQDKSYSLLTRLRNKTTSDSIPKISSVRALSSSEDALVESNLFEPVTGFVFKWDQSQNSIKLMELEKELANFWKNNCETNEAVDVSNEVNNGLKLFYNCQSQNTENLNDTSL